MVYHKRVYTPNNHSEPTRPLRYDYLVLSTMCPSLIYESMEDLFRAVNKIVVRLFLVIANFCYPGAAKPILCRNYLQQITAVQDAQILGESQCITTYTQHIYNGKGQTAARRHTLSVCLADHLTAVRIATDAKIRRFVGVFVFHSTRLSTVYTFSFHIKETLIFILKIRLSKIIVCTYIMSFG